MAKRRRRPADSHTAQAYRHPESELALRPDVGTQDQFKKKKKPVTYRYDSSLSPALEWDDQNPAREQGEALIRQVLEAPTLEEAKAAAAKLRALGEPFLNWAGKAEHAAFDVPTLPLFVHERLSTKAIIETLRGHKRQKQQQGLLFDLYGDPERDIADQVLKAYEYQDQWVNRMVLGDSLVVMNSLLQYEGLGGKVQMVYMDPPYGVQFGSNFQPFVRQRERGEVKHNDDAHISREPEMVQAYRDTWELGLHSYLSYLRDRLYLCRELLHSSGSIFVQINDANVHHVREVLDEVFGPECFIVTFVVKKKGSQKSSLVDPVNDYVLWYGREPRSSGSLKFRHLYQRRSLDVDTAREFKFVELEDGSEHSIAEVPTGNGDTKDYRQNPSELFTDHPTARLFRSNPLTSGGVRKNQSLPYTYEGKTYNPGAGKCWKTKVQTNDGSPPGMDKLAREGRLIAGKGQLRFKSYLDDFGYQTLSNWWDGLGGASNPLYVVQTNTEIIQRCMLMTTEPGDLVLDPTCGSGSTAYVAEQWGRRWITSDVSRVPLALARQRLLTATFPWYELRSESRGPIGGFVYERKQNRQRQEVGGIVPHVTLGSIANDEPAEEELLVDRPNKTTSITRVTGPFCFEATIPTAHDWDDGSPGDGSMVVREEAASYGARMVEVLRHSPLLHLEGGKVVKLKNVRPPAKTLSLSAEALVENGEERPVAFVFGPEDGAVSQNLVFNAAREASAKDYTHLYVIGFAIQPTARKLVDDCAQVVGIAATYVQATPDLLMGDLLKNMRSSQIFSVCGLPEVKVHKKKGRYQVELIGLDVFDPITMDVDGRSGDDVPAWMLDIDYNGLCFHVSQAFFPRTSAWDNLKKTLKATHEESVWDHLSGTLSAPFEAGEHGQVAVKVIDDRGNELMVVENLGG